MAITWNDLFGPIIDLVAEDRDAKASVLAVQTSKQAYPSIGSAVATEEYQTTLTSGRAAFDATVGAFGSIQSINSDTIRGSWAPFGVRYMQDNDTGYDAITSEWGDYMRGIIVGMQTDTESVDDSAPSVDTVRYGTQNQGDGTATIAINSNTTLAELALAGIVELRCRLGNFNNQNAETWTLSWRGDNPRTGLTQTRTSPTSVGARGLKTGQRYFDVAATSYPGVGLSPEPEHQIPQLGGDIHTGLNILITAPTYTPSEGAGDTDNVFTAVSVNLVDGAKSNLTKRNTAPTAPGTFYLAVVKSGSNYECTWYQDSAKTVALTETLTFTTSDATATYTWKAAATNPEAFLPGRFLTTDSNFVSATVAAASFTQSVDITYTANLPFATGDTITINVTNGYTGSLQRWFVEEGGVALPTANSPSIADPL